MFPPYPTMTVFGPGKCIARINRNCTGQSVKHTYRMGVGDRRYTDMCEKCEQTYRRRYNKAIQRAADAAMNGELCGGVRIVY